MPRRSIAIVISVLLICLVSWPVQAGTPKGAGYWDHGQWIGYQPPHLKDVQQMDDSSDIDVPRPAARSSKVKYATGTKRRGAIPTSFDEINPIEADGPATENADTLLPESCDEPGCGECMDLCMMCRRPRIFWGRADYLGWWKKGMNVPALVTTNPTTTPSLDDATTVILYGDDTINKDATSGGRFTLGMWLDPCQQRGLDFTYLMLGDETASYYASSPTYTILGRPFFNIENGADDAHLICFDDPAYTGWVNVSAETRFQGSSLIYRRAVKRAGRSRVDFLMGWRWLQLKDDLLISESVTQVGVGTIDLSDRFNTRNNFHGVEFGVHWQRPLPRAWTIEVLGKMALGNTSSTVTIEGQQTAVTSQGLLALDSNSGIHKANTFATVAEIGISAKRRFAPGWQATFGYTFMYWSDVMRAGDQIDLDVDLRQVPPAPQTATHPGVPMTSTGFWAQGLHCGLEYTF
ncbi:MAG: BBP7 family outer membrane beta-barrel protein [Pirellulales bacterium]|nr:BBP7 family outer membrane beta-barrel protein [Pirellulales bacterium]